MKCQFCNTDLVGVSSELHCPKCHPEEKFKLTEEEQHRIGELLRWQEYSNPKPMNPTTEQIPTPLTEAKLQSVLSSGGEIHWGDNKAKDMATFARELERKLAIANERVKKLEKLTNVALSDLQHCQEQHQELLVILWKEVKHDVLPKWVQDLRTAIDTVIQNQK